VTSALDRSCYRDSFIFRRVPIAIGMQKLRHGGLPTWTDLWPASWRVPGLEPDGLTPPTFTTSTAGPLVVMLAAAQSLISTLYSPICISRQIQNHRQSVNLAETNFNDCCTQITIKLKKLCAFTNICNSKKGTTTLTRTV
jgi:hypothetical protein